MNLNARAAARAAVAIAYADEGKRVAIICGSEESADRYREALKLWPMISIIVLDKEKRRNEPV